LLVRERLNSQSLAIENVRLFKELQDRNAELREAAAIEFLEDEERRLLADCFRLFLFIAKTKTRTGNPQSGFS